MTTVQRLLKKNEKELLKAQARLNEVTDPHLKAILKGIISAHKQAIRELKLIK